MQSPVLLVRIVGLIDFHLFIFMFHVAASSNSETPNVCFGKCNVTCATHKVKGHVVALVVFAVNNGRIDWAHPSINRSAVYIWQRSRMTRAQVKVHTNICL